MSAFARRLRAIVTRHAALVPGRPAGPGRAVVADESRADREPSSRLRSASVRDLELSRCERESERLAVTRQFAASRESNAPHQGRVRLRRPPALNWICAMPSTRNTADTVSLAAAALASGAQTEPVRPEAALVLSTGTPSDATS